MGGKRKLTQEHAPLIACSAPQTRAYDLLAPEYEFLDPNPDIHALFLEYNGMFFEGKLAGCEVKSSKRMTLCAGLCSYQPSSGFCSIRLSEPLLKLRPRSDLVNTLIHEMIHAFIFVSSPVRDHEDHGPIFQSHMQRINRAAGTVITVFHTFHDEVDAYRQHWWQCDGPCRHKKPYFGMVKRAMNRVPGPLDRWWEDHQKTCGGTYTKIKEPPGFKEKQEKLAQRKKKKELPTSVKTFFPTLSQPKLDDKPEPRVESKPGSTNARNSSSSSDAGVLVNKPKNEGVPGTSSWLVKPRRQPKQEATPKPTYPEPTPQPAILPTLESYTTDSIPSHVVVAAGDDGDFFLVGDLSAMFQKSPRSRNMFERRSEHTGVVDLTVSDDEEAREDEERQHIAHAAETVPARASCAIDDDGVEIIEIE